MELSLYSPLEYYEKGLKEIHDKNVKEAFDALVSSSKVKVEENRKTVAEYKSHIAQIEKLKGTLTKYKVFRVLLIILAALCIAGAVLFFFLGMELWLKITLAAVSLCVSVVSFVIAIKKLGNLIKQNSLQLEDEEREAARLLSKAWEQMEPLNRAFDDGITFSLIEKTLPAISFDKQFTPGKLKYLCENYAYEDSDSISSSVVDTVSGSLLENPFLFERTLECRMGSETYHGELLIRWTSYERTKNGMRAVTRTQLLHASVVKPKPEYSTETKLNFGHQTAQELNFSRQPSHLERLSEKEFSKYVKKGEGELLELAEKSLAEGGNFTAMANTEFEVSFGAYDRDNEQQFRVMFTPLSQIETVKLLRSDAGFGDDFSFVKRGSHNLITSEHMQNWKMDTSAKNYYSYDFDSCREGFINFNNLYFKSVYFDFAPLLAVPAYQAEPVASMEPFDSEFHYTAKEYETMANKIGREKFAHENTATEVILKTVPVRAGEKSDTVEVIAYSYAAVKRTDYVPTFGGDGRMHAVPVPWIEYIPLTKRTLIGITELDMSETAFGRIVGDVPSVNAAAAACYHGLFAHIGYDGEDAPTIEEMALAISRGTKAESTEPEAKNEAKNETKENKGKKKKGKTNNT